MTIRFDERDVALVARAGLAMRHMTEQAAREKARMVLLELHARGWRSGDADDLTLPPADAMTLQPVILYFRSAADRQELIRQVCRAHPQSVEFVAP